MQIKISPGNTKMGAIPSISLPAVLTCRRDAPCTKKCYAAKLERLRPTVKAAYQHNLDVLQNDPDTYWRDVEGTVMLSRFFRFHVSGDIPNAEYFEKMCEVAGRNPHCQILCFTKQYGFVNDILRHGFSIPKNLHVIFSVWRELHMCNPYRLPEAHVLYADGSTTARDDAVKCHGNCSECAKTDAGCWTLQPGQQVVFHEH